MLIAVLMPLTVRFTITGDLDGLYFLKGARGRLLEVKDTVLLGEHDRVLLQVDLGEWHLSPREMAAMPSDARLRYQWNESAGHGFIQALYHDGTKFLAAIGRYMTESGRAPAGLFVGGGLPYREYEDREVALNETGMAFYTGSEWHHLWCNVNEALFLGGAPRRILFPSSWEYLGSDVLYENDGRLIIRSDHQLDLDGVPLRITRFVLYRTGDRHIVLLMRFRNDGARSVSYSYVYGDEPWVGEYGTSAGNIGWTRDREYRYESHLDTKRYSWAGMWDAGDRFLPQEGGRAFTGVANFIDWSGGVRPDDAYFSNQLDRAAPESARVPLSSGDNRVIMLNWQDRVLAPSASENIILAVGMADSDPETGFPVRPPVSIDPAELSILLTLP
jgi:hypothetical protein